MNKNWIIYIVAIVFWISSVYINSGFFLGITYILTAVAFGTFIVPAIKRARKQVGRDDSELRKKSFKIVFAILGFIAGAPFGVFINDVFLNNANGINLLLISIAGIFGLVGAVASYKLGSILTKIMVFPTNPDIRGKTKKDDE